MITRAQIRRQLRQNGGIMNAVPREHYGLGSFLKKADLTSTSATTLYTVPTATTAVIKSILVSEDSGNADTITITLTDADAAVFSLFKTKAISANATTELLTAPLVVQESEIVKVTAATANRLHVVLSALEIKPREVTT